MRLNEDLKNCRMIVLDIKTGRTLIDTTVLSYDAATDEIEVRTNRIVLKEDAEIKGLLFLSAGLYEVLGTVHKKTGKQTKITLHDDPRGHARQAIRYLVNIHGNVDRIERPGEGRLAVDFEIVVLNMSSTGLLVRAPKGMVREDDTIRITSMTKGQKGQKIIITAKVMRLQEETTKKEKFGCSILLVNLG